MRTRLVAPHAVLAALVSAAAAVLVCGCARTTPASGPVAVVLVQDRARSQLVAVDLERFEVLERVRLRSLCLSIDGDPLTRTVVTAQCGGPDRLADRACGLWQPGRGGSVRYVELDAPNPLFVAAQGGRALLVHGFEQSDGLRTSLVDIAHGSVSATGFAPLAAGAPVRVGMRIVVPAADAAASSTTPGARLLGLDGAQAARPVAAFEGADSVTALTVVDGGASAVLAAVRSEGRRVAGRDESATWRLVRLGDAGDLSEVDRATGLAGVTHGAHAIAASADEVFVADADGLDLADPGRDIIVVDARTLAERRRLTLEGMPAALATCAEGLLVFDGLTGELLLYRDGGDKPARRLALGGEPLGTGDLVVFER